MKAFLISIFFITLLLSGYGQNNIENDSLLTETNVTVIKDWRINQINETYKESYALIGYRIQLFSGNKRQPARVVKSKFVSNYQHVKAHEIYQQPNFKIRVGDFKTKIEALKFQKEILADFPNSYIVKDEIDVEELIKTR